MSAPASATLGAIDADADTDTAPPRRFAGLRPAPDSILAEARRAGRSGWAEGLQLLWTVWVFVVPTFTPSGYDLRWSLLTLFSYPAFLGLFAAALLLPRRRIVPIAAAMIVLCAALLPWYPAGLSYFVFGCVYLGTAGWRSAWRYAGTLLLLCLGLLAWARLWHYPWSAIAWMPVTVLIVGLLSHIEHLRRSRDAALRLSQAEVRRLAALAERERISRDLHDLLGHTLSVVVLKADLAQKLVERDPAAARREAGEVGVVARAALAQVREAVSGIRAPELAAELASARLLLESAGIALDAAFDATLAGTRLPAEITTALAMTLREAVTNAQRHARAQRVEVAVSSAAGQVCLRVRDDGAGGEIRPGNGLRGMRERIEALGGRLRIDSDAAGTRVEARLPLDARRG